MGYIGNRPTAVPLTSADIQDGSVDSSELVDNSVTLAKMAGLARGKLIYGDASGDPAALAVGGADEVLTHDGTDFDWAAAGGFDVSSITGATALAATPADTDEFVLSDGGVLKRIDYSLIKAANTPAFYAEQSASQDCGDQAYTVIAFDQVVFNVGGGTYDDTTNYDWTPGVAGKYWVGSSLRWNSTTNTVQQWRNQIQIDGSTTVLDSGEYGADWGTNQCSGILTLTDANAISVRVYQNSGGTMATGDNDSQIWFAAFLLTGA